MTSKDERAQICELLVDCCGLSMERCTELLEIPSDRSKGDFALPCFKLAAELRQPPVKIAADFCQRLIDHLPDGVSSVEATGPYLNFRMDPHARLRKVLGAIQQQGAQYGHNQSCAGKTVVLDFSSPNIAKPFNIGHLRSTVIGSAVARLLESQGYSCVRVNHLGDWGTQFGKLIEAYQLWGDQVDLEGGHPIKALLELYVRFHAEAETQPELEDKGREWFKRLEDGDTEAMRIWNWFKDLSLAEFERIYQRLGVQFDSYAGESFYNDKMDRVLKLLDQRGLLVESRGARIVDLEPYGLTPVIIQRSDEATLYATRDLAAAYYRHDTYQFDKNLYFVATQQNEHFKQIFKVLELLGEDWADKCEHVAFGMISFEEGTMSTRKGKVIFLEDVLNQAVERVGRIIAEKNPDLDNPAEVAEQIGVGAIVFYDLARRRIKDWVFAWDRILNFDGETGPYVMYTHARMCSILRKAAERELAPLDDLDQISYAALESEQIQDVIMALEEYPNQLARAAEQYEPSILAQSLVEIADRCNRFYNAEQVLVDDLAVARTRLLLVDCVVQVLAGGLSLLGLSAPERM